MVRRSAPTRLQMSCPSSSMISSTLLVAWILLVTACSCFWNSSLLLMSARFCGACGLDSNTVLMRAILQLAARGAREARTAGQLGRLARTA